MGIPAGTPVFAEPPPPGRGLAAKKDTCVLLSGQS